MGLDVYLDLYPILRARRGDRDQKTRETGMPLQVLHTNDLEDMVQIKTPRAIPYVEG